jgi:dTDP-4-dehydrorhamnose 3,5-epimerase
MKIVESSLPGVLLIEARVFSDERGAFWESWRADRYAAAGIPGPFVQDNVSISRRGVLRGLHFQHPRPQGKLVSALEGAVWDVAVDVRPESPHFKRWFGVELRAGDGRQLWIPPGFAHGFCTLTERAVFAYKCSEVYVPEADGGLRWDDPDLGVAWPIEDPVLSAKDAALPTLAQWLAKR